MEEDLYEELKQTRPFANLEHAAQLSIVRTSSMLVDAFERMLKPHGITATQYNVLRILRGSEPGGLCRTEIGARMVNRMPDVTRLLDRMEDAGFIARERSTQDRRMVRTRITGQGHALLERLEAEVAEEQKRPFSDLTVAELRALIDLLARVRRGI